MAMSAEKGFDVPCECRVGCVSFAGVASCVGGRAGGHACGHMVHK